MWQLNNLLLHTFLFPNPLYGLEVFLSTCSFLKQLYCVNCCGSLVWGYTYIRFIWSSYWVCFLWFPIGPEYCLENCLFNICSLSSAFFILDLASLSHCLHYYLICLGSVLSETSSYVYSFLFQSNQHERV